MDAMSGDISTMIDHLGWDKPVLVGHSMAGRNSIIYVAEFVKNIEADRRRSRAGKHADEITGSIPEKNRL